MQAALWGMDHFNVYLRGRLFILYTDHLQLEKLRKVHSKTLNRLQEAMGRCDFEIRYKKGSKMPADYLSHNVVKAISWETQDLWMAQDNDNFIKSLKNCLLNKELPKDLKCQTLFRHFANNCFIENDVVWKRVKRNFEPSRVVIFLTESLVSQVLQEAHWHLLSGHDGIYKTKERLLRCYYWLGMDADNAQHIHHCHSCQIWLKDLKPRPTLVSSLPQTTEPNQCIHADLFGPLRTSGNGKQMICDRCFHKVCTISCHSQQRGHHCGIRHFWTLVAVLEFPLKLLLTKVKNLPDKCHRICLAFANCSFENHCLSSSMQWSSQRGHLNNYQVSKFFHWWFDSRMGRLSVPIDVLFQYIFQSID